MGTHSTIFVTYESAKKAFVGAVGASIPEAFFRDLGEKNFENLLDQLLHDRDHNVLFVSQKYLDEERHKPYALTCGGLDLDGSEIRYHIGQVIQTKGFKSVRKNIARFDVCLDDYD